jgi:hypothetical protein
MPTSLTQNAMAPSWPATGLVAVIEADHVGPFFRFAGPFLKLTEAISPLSFFLYQSDARWPTGYPGVVAHPVQDHVHAQRVRLLHQLAQIVERAEFGIDAPVVRTA